MKYIIILGDGMADEPLQAYGNKTPLQMANKPAIDRLAKLGRTGTFKTVDDSMHPGSEVANMAVLGYDVPAVFEGRGSLEAASMGVKLESGDLAMRLNLISVKDGNIKNHSAGHISDAEAHELIDYLKEKLGSEKVIFHKGVSYRHVLVVKGGLKDLDCTPPHDVPGKPFADYLVKAKTPHAQATADLLNELTSRSMDLLKEHPVNKKRAAAGKDTADSIWAWSPGYKPAMPTLKELFGIQQSAVISAVDLIHGIGAYAGMEVIKVEGATGLHNTNYEGKAKATIEALKRGADLVYLHIEASDEAGHEGDVELKIKTIEYLDQRVVKYIVEQCEAMDEPVAIAVLPDHPTPCATTVHTRVPVPFLIYKPAVPPDAVESYDEFTVAQGSYGLLQGDEFMKEFLDVPLKH
ncbi:MAG: cofactor-independent phosphoglycerate mutase [Mangrovibacterium sp.]